MTKQRAATWAVRLCFALVFCWNVLCALQFVFTPADYVASYQLDAAIPQAGIAAVQGLGVAFLMWNVTYPLFIWKPSEHRTLGVIVLIQQAIGLMGELYIASALGGAEMQVLSNSIARFVGFDALGFVLMCAAFLIWRKA